MSRTPSHFQVLLVLMLLLASMSPAMATTLSAQGQTDRAAVVDWPLVNGCDLAGADAGEEVAEAEGDLDEGLCEAGLLLRGDSARRCWRPSCRIASQFAPGLAAPPPQA